MCVTRDWNVDRKSSNNCNLMDFECGVKRAITNSDRGQRTHILAELLQNGDDQIRDFSFISLFEYIY